MGFKAYFDRAQRRAYACEAGCGRHGITVRTRIRAGALTATQDPVSLSSAGAGTASHPPPVLSGGGWGWKVECTPHVGILRQLTKLQRCSQPSWCFQFLASTHYPLIIISRMTSVGVGGFCRAWLELLSTVMNYNEAWSCQTRESEPQHTAAIPASAEMRKLKINPFSPPPRGTFWGLEQTSVEWSQCS